MATSKLIKASDETVKVEPREQSKEVLFELAWEVCNQVGGIYTVIRSKVPAMVEKWGEDYCLIGPFFSQTASIEFEASVDDSPYYKASEALNKMGFTTFYGHWLVTGRPKIILIDFNSALAKVDDLKFDLWDNHKVSTLNAEPLVNQVIAFGHVIEV
jgi:glycogen synthase